MSKNSLIIICCILFVVIAVLIHMLKEFKWYQKSYYELANKIAKDRRDRKMLVRADREMIKSEIDKKFLAILRISQREDYPRNRFELGYESGRFEVEVKNLFLSGGLTTHEEKFLKKVWIHCNVWSERKGGVVMKLSGRGLATTIIIALAAGQLCVIGLRNFLDFIFR